MNQINSALSAFMFTLKKFSCMAVLIILPLNFLWKIDPMLLSSDVRRIIVDTGFMVVFLFLLALLGALIAGLFYLLCSYFLKKETLTRIIIFYNIIPFAIAGVEFARSIKLWISRLFGVVFITPLFIKLAVFVLFLAAFYIAFLFSDRIVQAFERETNRFFKAVIAVVVLSAVIIAGQVSYSYLLSKPADTGISATAGAGNRQNVILITFDALAANDMSLYGYGIKTTPNMDLFARESCVFTNMYANSNWTLPGVVSIITGTYPSTHRLINKGIMNCFLPDGLKGKSIASILRNNGYQTAAVVSNPSYAHPTKNDTINGFDYAPMNTVYNRNIVDQFLESLEPFFYRIKSRANLWLRDVLSSENILKIIINDIKSMLGVKNKWSTTTPQPPELTFNLACEYILEAKSPFFLWVHVYTPHDPYLPADKFKKRFLQEDAYLTNEQQEAVILKGPYYYPKEMQPEIDKLRLRYDEHILYADHEFGVFLNRLRQGGFLDTSVVVVSSDHGESFNHGYVTHNGPPLYDDLIHIPLIIHTPEQRHKDISSPTEQVDIMPTILDLLKIDIPPWLEGESAKKTMDDQVTGNKTIYSMQLDGNNIKGRIKKGTIAVIEDRYKYIYYLNDEKGELYNLDKDPDELNNLVEVEKQRATIMKNLIRRKILGDI